MSDPSKNALVVEDEPLIAMLAREILTDFGYTVFEARTAGDALSILSLEDGITLLFTDIDLADGSYGVDLAKEIARSRPEISIVVTSGRGRSAVLPRRAQFLPKPYTEEDLAKALFEPLLDPAGPLISVL
jgi:CheY-like chemotaxis protein